MLAWKAWAWTLLIIGGVGAIIVGSDSFRQCLRAGGDYEAAHTDAWAGTESLLVRSPRCVGAFIEANDKTIEAVSTLSIAIFTLTLWLSTRGVLTATKATVELARQEFLATHRPKIIMREAFIGAPQEGAQIVVYFQIANVGETTGTIIKSTVGVQVTAGLGLLGQSSVEISDDLGPIRLGPGEATLIKFAKDTPTWEPGKFATRSQPIAYGPPIEIRHTAIHFYGAFIYVDENEIPRRTVFRRELVPERQRFYRLRDEPDLDYAD